MHDVLVLALTIFFVKSQGVYDATSLYGVYFFTAAVLLMILAYAWIRTDGLDKAGVVADSMPLPDISSPKSNWRNFTLSFLIIVIVALTWFLSRRAINAPKGLAKGTGASAIASVATPVGRQFGNQSGQFA